MTGCACCRWPAVAECRACLLAEVRMKAKAPRLRKTEEILAIPEVTSVLKQRAQAVAIIINDKLGQMGRHMVRCAWARALVARPRARCAAMCRLACSVLVPAGMGTIVEGSAGTADQR